MRREILACGTHATGMERCSRAIEFLAVMKMEDDVSRLVGGVSDLVDRPLFQIAGTHISMATLISIGVVLFITIALARLFARGFGRLLRRRGKTGEGEIRALEAVLRYAVWLTGGAIAFSTAGLNLNALFAAGAVFAVAIGFALQNVVQNFVAGIILLVERAIKPGDVLEVEGQMVKVVRMGVRTTVARTLDDEDLIVPNGTLVQSTVKNLTLRDAEFRLRMRVGVAYSSDMDYVLQVLSAAAAAVPWRLLQQEPRVILLEFASSSVDWEVSVWIDDPWRVRSRRSDLQLAIWRALKEAGITIAFPQLDVHFDPPVPAGNQLSGGEEAMSR